MTTATANNAQGQFKGFFYSLPTHGFTSLHTHDVPLLRASAGVSRDLDSDRYTFNIDTEESTLGVQDVENRPRGVL